MKPITKTLLISVMVSLAGITSSTKVLAFDWPFHRKMAMISYDMMSVYYPKLMKEPLYKGSTQPDPEKKRGPLGPVGTIFENPLHKKDTGRINQNYHDAVNRFREHGEYRGLYEGQRILAKSFHYICDQTEPTTDKRFIYLFNGKSFRQVAEDIVITQYQYGDFRAFLNNITFDTEKFLAERGFNPRDKYQMRQLIVSLKQNTEQHIHNVLNGSHPPSQQRAIENIIVHYYLPKLLALQNLLIVNFFWEINFVSPKRSIAEAQPQLNNPRIRKPAIIPKKNPFKWKDPGPVSVANPRPTY